jgi:HD-like signal output (HDOD) protein
MAIPKGLIEGIGKLDPLPVTGQRLARAIAGEHVSVDELAELIEYDQAVTTSILRLANSPLHAGLVPAERVRDAVIRLGTNALLGAVLGDYLKRLSVKAPLYDLTEHDLWLHSAVASLAVDELRLENPQCAIPPSASVAALIHDVGKLVIVRYMKADVGQLLKQCRERNITFVEAERAVLGCDHAEVGGTLARMWRFPGDIVDALERHHAPPRGESTPTLDAVILANLVAKTLGTGLGAEGMNFSLDTHSAQRQGIGFAGFCRVCARTSLRIEELKQASGLSPTGWSDGTGKAA